MQIVGIHLDGHRIAVVKARETWISIHGGRSNQWEILDLVQVLPSAKSFQKHYPHCHEDTHGIMKKQYHQLLRKRDGKYSKKKATLA